MPKLNVDQIISQPKNTLEEVATIFFIIMTCPDVKKHEDKLVLHLEEMIMKIDQLPKDQWRASQELATDMALTEHMPFYNENLDWIQNYIDDVLKSSTTQIQELGGVH